MVVAGLVVLRSPDSRAGRSAEHQCIVWGPGAQSTGTRAARKHGRPQRVRHRPAWPGTSSPPSCSARRKSPPSWADRAYRPTRSPTSCGLHRISCPTRTAWGTDITAAAPVYDGSGWSAVRTQKLTESQPDDPDSPLFWVQQAAVAFPRPTWLARSPASRRTNGGDARARVVKESGDAGALTWTYGDLPRRATPCHS